ncbi:Cutin hydrolase [Hyphodiscus hymeniophilus]|uniref:Cutin hydrolase n=1 Tax=Hyphodiscus hymeniophilus TaxID=353542 RepID=A0A9P6VKA4_9HELO|nr:Cutin hydrolase [Hyphodiscus hymeniophilus]
MFLDDHDTVVFQNDVLKNASECAAMTVLASLNDDNVGLGNVGILTGPPFFAAIVAYINGTGKLAIQGVDYPASPSDFLAGGSPLGATMM